MSHRRDANTKTGKERERMKLSDRESAIVFHFAGDFFLYVEIFTATRKPLCGCDATVNPVIASVQVIIILISIITWRDFLSPIARKRNTFIYIAFIFDVFCLQIRRKLHPEANAVTLVGLFVDDCSTEHLVISACGINDITFRALFARFFCQFILQIA